ncbi:FAD:protein FMN transferase [Nocardioides sp. MAHUQ-72]|uniref:FAD:protein FMN transferase n=1 Tax=unclassified Nocardioides TaxID=2615069 RepID=UPI003623BA06
MEAARDWDLWSTRARLVVTEPAAMEQALLLVDDLLAEVERAASRFRPDSEVSTLRPGPDGTVLVSPVLADLLAEALDAARRTDGAVDPTIGATLSALGYDRDIRLVESGTGLVALVRPVPGWRTLRLAGRRLGLPDGIELDLGATAKAVAADRAAALVAERLGVGVLVSLGGDIATAGPAPAGGWQVRVQDTDTDPAAQVSLPAGSALATSSTVRRTWRRGSETLHHIVDPRTGRPADPVWRSVSVAAATCSIANAAATATVVKGPAGLGWLGAQGLPARLVDRTGAIHLCNGWPGEPEGEAA